MTKKLTLATIGFGVLFLVGCGGGTTTSTPSETVNSIEVAQEKLKGTWVDNNVGTNGCRSHEQYSSNTSFKETIHFLNDVDVEIDSKDYNNTTCDESGLTLHDTTKYEYSIVSESKSSTGKDAFNMDYVQTGWTLHVGSSNGAAMQNIGQTHKTMFLFDGDHLVFSKQGETEDIRTNDFNLSDYWVKQP